MASCAAAASISLLVAGLAVLGLVGCVPSNGGDVAVRPLRVEDLAKSAVDDVAEIHLQEVRNHLGTLMRKLYRRNPAQWRRGGSPSAEFMVQRVFRGPRVPDFVQLRGHRGVDAVRLAFEEDFEGDRVLALVAGLAAMVDRAYANKREFYVVDQLDPQKLYNSARNVEVAAWLLRSRLGPDGRPLLLSHSLENEKALNLSFERLFGKIIALQDSLALVMAGRTNRTIRTVVQRMTSAVFLPL